MLPAIYMSLIDDTDDKAVFKKIYNSHRNMMLAYAYNILKDHSLAEDAVSEAFFKLAKNFQKVHNFKMSQIVAYTVIIIRNQCIDILKAENKQNALLKASPEENSDPIAEYEVADLLIGTAVQHLPDIYKDVIILRYFFGFSLSDIAEQLDLSYSAVKKRIAAALRMLRKELNDD